MPMLWVLYDSSVSESSPKWTTNATGNLLLTRININPNMEKFAQDSAGWDCLSIPKL